MPGPEIRSIGSSPAAASPVSDISLIEVLPQHRLDEAALWNYLQRHLEEDRKSVV